MVWSPLLTLPRVSRGALSPIWYQGCTMELSREMDHYAGESEIGWESRCEIKRDVQEMKNA